MSLEFDGSAASGTPSGSGEIVARTANASQVDSSVRRARTDNVLSSSHQSESEDIRKSRGRERELRALALIREGGTSRQLVRRLAEEFKVSGRTATRDLARARSRIVDEIRVEAGTIRAENYVRYLSLYQDTSIPPIVRLKALTRIDRLLGLESPQRVSLEPPEDEELQHEAMKELPSETLEAIQVAYAKARERLKRK